VPIKIYLKKLEENFSMQEILTALWKDVAGIKAWPPKQQQRWPVILYAGPVNVACFVVWFDTEQYIRVRRQFSISHLR
jgi:hypothetical protein